MRLRFCARGQSRWALLNKRARLLPRFSGAAAGARARLVKGGPAERRQQHLDSAAALSCASLCVCSAEPPLYTAMRCALQAALFASFHVRASSTPQLHEAPCLGRDSPSGSAVTGLAGLKRPLRSVSLLVLQEPLPLRQHDGGC